VATSHDDWTALLLPVLDDPGREAEIVRRHGAVRSVLVCDFTGMTTRSARDGIVYALALCAAARRALEPVLAGHGGALVTSEADTIFVLFEAPADAVHAALDAQRALAAFNQGRDGHVGDGSRRDPIHASIGLGHGEMLLLPGRDVFGAEVNHAFVLGEDVARPRETLATEAFLAALGVPPDGVGVFRAPEERAAEAGFGFHVLADYRG
jgi:adenylate cyclase